MDQLSIDDLLKEHELENVPGRTAYIDECGNFGFDFSKEGVSKYYILCAVIAKNTDLQKLHNSVLTVKRNNGFASSELKSSGIGNNYNRRSKIVTELLPIEFRVALLVADKQSFIDGSPLTEYRKTFIKFLHQRLYAVLYKTYPKLRIIEDEIGSTEFQESFKAYVRSHQPINLFSEYEFGYCDSKDGLLVQLADFIGGTISKVYTDERSPNYLEILKGKILCIEEFPNKTAPYFGVSEPGAQQYDEDIFQLSSYRARDYISKYEQDDSLEKCLQVALLKYLLFHVHNVDATKYISSYQLISVLEEYTETRIRLNFLYRRVIAPLRDAGVILASSTQGYKIPISAKDVTTYINQTHTVVSPMLHRIGICRDLIKLQTDGKLDVLDDPAFLKYKNYFD